jgi:hypothetical protein
MKLVISPCHFPPTLRQLSVDTAVFHDFSHDGPFGRIKEAQATSKRDESACESVSVRFVFFSIQCKSANQITEIRDISVCESTGVQVYGREA